MAAGIAVSAGSKLEMDPPKSPASLSVLREIYSAEWICVGSVPPPGASAPSMIKFHDVPIPTDEVIPWSKKRFLRNNGASGGYVNAFRRLVSTVCVVHDSIFHTLTTISIHS